MTNATLNPKLAAKAHRLQRAGIRGRELAQALGKGLTTYEANSLAAVGHDAARERASLFTENEIKVLVALLKLQRIRRARGEVSSPKAWMLRGLSGLSDGQIRRATVRLREPDHENRHRWGLLQHSVNGHIWLKPAGIAIAAALIESLEQGK